MLKLIRWLVATCSTLVNNVSVAAQLTVIAMRHFLRVVAKSTDTKAILTLIMALTLANGFLCSLAWNLLFAQFDVSLFSVCDHLRRCSTFLSSCLLCLVEKCCVLKLFKTFKEVTALVVSALLQVIAGNPCVEWELMSLSFVLILVVWCQKKHCGIRYSNHVNYLACNKEIRLSVIPPFWQYIIGIRKLW